MVGRKPVELRTENHPVNCVDWFRVEAYCEWAHVGERRPTEAEWEYAARSGGKAQTYPWGEGASCGKAVMLDTGTSPSAGCGVKTTWETCAKTGGNSSQGPYDLGENPTEFCSDWICQDLCDTQARHSFRPAQHR